MHGHYQDLVDFMGDTQKISEAENERLEEPFTTSELAALIKTMSNDKAPASQASLLPSTKYSGIKLATW